MKTLLHCIMLCCVVYAPKVYAATDSCSYKLPKTINMRDYKDVAVITNYLTEKQFILDKSTGSLHPVAIDSGIVARLFTQELHLPEYYQTYLQLMKKNSQLRPRMTAVAVGEDGAIKGCMVCFIPGAVKGSDTFFNKVLSLASMDKQGNIIDLAVIDTSLHQLNEYNFFPDRDRVYFGYMDRDTNSPDRYKILCKLKRSGNFYRAEGAPAYELSPYLVKSGVLYNYSQLSYSGGYWTTNLLDYIGNVRERGRPTAIPVEKDIFSKIEMNGLRSPEYILDEFKYDAASGLFTCLYRLHQVKYVSTFKTGDKAFRTTNKLIDMSRYMDILKICALSYDGRNLVYVLKDEHCIRTCSFAYFEANYAQ